MTRRSMSNRKRPPSLPLSESNTMMLFKVTLLLVFTVGTGTTAWPSRVPRYNQRHQQRTYDDKHITISNNDDDTKSNSQGALLHYQAQNTDGYYKFGYANPDGQYRVEEGSPDEGILGSYGYVSNDGRDVKVYYSAGVHGFRIITATLYKAMLNRRTKKLMDLPGDLEIEVEPYEPEMESYPPEVEPVTSGGPPSYPEIQSPIRSSPPFGFISYRTAGRQQPSPPSAPPTTTTTELPTTTIPTTTTTTSTTTTSPPTTATSTTTDAARPQNPRSFDQSTSPAIFPPHYHPYMSSNYNSVPWRFPQQIPPLMNHQVAPLWNQAPFPVYYHPQLGIHPLPVSGQPQFPRPNVQPPIIIRV